MTPSETKRGRNFMVMLLVAMTIVTFSRILTNGFVDFDDSEYVTGNPAVRVRERPS